MEVTVEEFSTLYTYMCSSGRNQSVKYGEDNHPQTNIRKKTDRRKNSFADKTPANKLDLASGYTQL